MTTMNESVEILAKQALELPNEQRLELIELLQNSLQVQLTDEQRLELARRLELHRQDPSRAIPLDEAMSRVHAELERRRNERASLRDAS